MNRYQLSFELDRLTVSLNLFAENFRPHAMPDEYYSDLRMYQSVKRHINEIDNKISKEKVGNKIDVSNAPYEPTRNITSLTFERIQAKQDREIFKRLNSRRR